MTFEQFRAEYGVYGAYTSWVTVAGAKEIGYIPEKYFPYFEEKCACGSDNIISSNLKREMCCDPKCVIKMGYQIAEFFHGFGIDGLGPANCLKIYKAFLDLDRQLKAAGREGIFRLGSYVELLLVPWEKYPLSISDTAAAQSFFEACVRTQQCVLTFPELVGKLRAPSIHGKAVSLFEGLNSFNELSSAIKEEGGIQQFCWNRGCYDTAVAYNLKVAMPDIAVADYVFRGSIRDAGLRAITVSITGRVMLNGTGMTKSRFIEQCNSLCCDSNGVQVYEVKLSDAVASNPFVLYSTPSGSAKYNKGLERGRISDEFGEHDVLMTVDAFYEMLGRMMQGWETKIKQEGQGMLPLTGF